MIHNCHNPNCRGPLPAHLVAHRSAWFALPRNLRAAIWREYRPGQENDKNPTTDYREALGACVRYWREKGTRCREIDVKKVSE